MKDWRGVEFELWTQDALQIASFYWRRPWWELSITEIEMAWKAHLGPAKEESSPKLA